MLGLNVDFIFFLPMIIGILLLCTAIFQRTEPLTLVAAADGERYLVLEGSTAQSAADLLAKLKAKGRQLVDELYNEYPHEDRVKLLKSRLGNINIRQGQKQKDVTSYSINKGEEIVMCLEAENEKFAEANTLFFVLLHEFAHVMTTSVGHTPEFWKNFKFLLEFAKRKQLYSYTDYREDPRAYCGITINNTPENHPT